MPFSEVRITPQIECSYDNKFCVRREDTRNQPTLDPVYWNNLLALLLVCRQIHVEMALLPFHELEFNVGYNCINSFNLLMGTITKKQRETISHIVLDKGSLCDIIQQMAHYWEREKGIDVIELPYDSYPILQQHPGLRLVTFEVHVSKILHTGPSDENAIKVALKQIGAHAGVEVKAVMVYWD
jgi:hypothetical protein